MCASLNYFFWPQPAGWELTNAASPGKLHFRTGVKAADFSFLFQQFWEGKLNPDGMMIGKWELQWYLESYLLCGCMEVKETGQQWDDMLSVENQQVLGYTLCLTDIPQNPLCSCDIEQSNYLIQLVSSLLTIFHKSAIYWAKLLLGEYEWKKCKMSTNVTCISKCSVMPQWQSMREKKSHPLLIWSNRKQKKNKIVHTGCSCSHSLLFVISPAISTFILNGDFFFTQK